VLKDELRKNRELQDNVKQLQGDVDKFQDSETMKRARAAYERARVSCLGCQMRSPLNEIGS
jgi:import inner membrane translocase subunit TIM44